MPTPQHPKRADESLEVNLGGELSLDKDTIQDLELPDELGDKLKGGPSGHITCDNCVVPRF